mgnify:CR=1 FL=1
MSFTVMKNGVGIMLGIYGNEFWHANGGVKYAFFSNQQINEKKSLHCRAKKTYDFLYSTWDDRVRERVIHNLEYGILACNDPILRNLYSKKPPPFVRDEFINRSGKKIEVSDVFDVRTYPKLDALRKELIYKYPDIEFRGLVVESENFDAMCEKKRQHRDVKIAFEKNSVGDRVSKMKENFIRNRKCRVHESREKINRINNAARSLESSQVWFQTDFRRDDVKEEESVLELHNRRAVARLKQQSRRPVNILVRKNRFLNPSIN